MLVELKNIQVPNSSRRALLTDVFFESSAKKKQVVIYAHGFKGFKDWGNFDLIARFFARQGLAFIKFNFSGNGMSLNALDEFDDLENFGLNNATTEIEDLQTMIDWVRTSNSQLPIEEIDENNLVLLGHSRGGGAVVINGSRNTSVKKIISWASVSDYNHIWKAFTDDEMEQWKTTGVAYTTNARTGQKMPLYYQLFEDYMNNYAHIDILQAARLLKKPWLICHGTGDEAVAISEAEKLHEAAANDIFFKVPGANHVFGRKHPWESNDLPLDTQAILKQSIAFIQGDL